MHVDRLRGAEAVLVHPPNARVQGDPVHPGMGGDRHAHLPRHLERGLLRERRVVTGDVEGDREPEHVALAVEPAHVEVAELRRGAPLPRALLDVPVGQHEPPAHLLQGVGGGVGVLGRLQPVRPVHRGRHPGVDRLDGRQQVPGVDVLRAELLAPVQVVPDEVLGQGPVGPVRPHGGLPHVPVRVDHARHDDAAGRVDLRGAVGHLQVGPTAAIRSPVTSTSAPVRIRCPSSIVSTVALRKTSGRPATRSAAVVIGTSTIGAERAVTGRAGGRVP